MRLTRTDLELEVVVRRIERGEIDLQPEFQRGEVWNKSRQTRLVDTILRGWYVPAIHLIQDIDGRDLVLDGQQRLLAIQAFFADQIRIDGGSPPANPQIEALDGRYFSDLPSDTAREVQRFPLSVITLANYEPDEPYELFFRLNQHLPLTPSEKRNALYGPARDQIKRLVRGLEAENLFSKEAVGFANGRLAYDDILARVALTLELRQLEGIQNSALEGFYRSADGFSDAVLYEAEQAARDLLQAALVVRPRFNKATLFTWLVYAATSLRRGRNVSPDLLSGFEARKASVVEGYSEASSSWDAVVRVYLDRGSYRVNDTLSIRLRDICVRLIASSLGYDELDPRLLQTSDLSERSLVELADSDWNPLVP